MSAVLPLINGDLDAPLAWRDGRPVSRRQYLIDVEALAARLPADGAPLNLTADRYRFAVGLGAALSRGQTSLLPPNHTADTIERLRALFAGAYALVDAHAPPVALPSVPYGLETEASSADLATSHFATSHFATSHFATSHVATLHPATLHPATPHIGAGHIAAQVLTSGSTGIPVPHAKPWKLLVENAGAESVRLAESMGRATLDGVALVATVPAQHMYGFESSVLLALLGGAAFDTERPFYPADIAAALDRLPRPRLLVTTPFHLKTLLDSSVALPPIDLTLCATAPLPPQLAARAEAALAAPLVEIYGCTEAGQVATRRTVAGAEWRVYDGLQLAGDGDRAIISGGHVPQPTPLADVLEVLDSEHFRLLGRSNDLVNIAGKRSSIGHLNHHLNAIEGVLDGAFWMPPERAGSAGIVRLVAFVVAPSLPDGAILGALRQRIDAAFLPRRIVRVESLPRDPSGKLPAARLAALAEQATRGGTLRASAAGPDPDRTP